MVRCDGAGVNVKMLANAASRDGHGPISAADYARLMNQSNFLHTFSFTFATINRGIGVFPVPQAETNAWREEILRDGIH